MRTVLLSALVVMLLCQDRVSAQSISGKLSLPDGKPAEYATVMLLSGKDSTLVRGEVANEQGGYRFENPLPGHYFLRMSMVGHADLHSEPFEFKLQELQMPERSFDDAGIQLQELTITAKKPLIEVNADKTILNVDAQVSGAGSNGLDLLRKAPGVVVDNNENIQLKGRKGVLVFLDGKQNFLSPAELANLLKGLNANDVQAIEIITNPSARYDASGNAGIINIRLKKHKGIGTNGTLNLTAGYGQRVKSDAGLTLNHRSKGVNVFGSAGAGYSDNENTLGLYRIQNGKIFDLHQSQVNEQRPLNARLGVDYFAGTRHTFGILGSMNTNYQSVSWNSESLTRIGPDMAPGQVDSILSASNRISGNRLNASLNANYRYADTLGNELTFDLDRGFFRASNHSVQPNLYLSAEGQVLSRREFRNNTPSDIDIWTVKTDYEHVFKRQGIRLSTGFKVSDVETDNTFDFFNVEDGQEVKDAARSNRFIYQERVYAGYANAQLPLLKKLLLQAGLRLENTRSIGDLRREPGMPVRPEDIVKRDYLDCFPSAAMTWNMSEKHALNLTYSRRIQRPNYEDLNPFEWKLDELTYRKGNPFLNPQYSNNLELGYTFLQAATLTLGYSRTKDLISDIVEKDPQVPNASFIHYRNLERMDNYSLSLNAPTPFNKWWNGFVSLTLFQSVYTADFPEYSFRAQTPLAVNLYAEQSFTLSRGFALEVSGWFNSASIWGGSWLMNPQGSLDLGLMKKVLQDRGTLKLSLTDVLHTAPWSSYSDAIPGLVIRGNGTWESQVVRLNFNYRFGNREVKASRQRQTGLEAENNRIKQ